MVSIKASLTLVTLVAILSKVNAGIMNRSDERESEEDKNPNIDPDHAIRTKRNTDAIDNTLRWLKVQAGGEKQQDQKEKLQEDPTSPKPRPKKLKFRQYQAEESEEDQRLVHYRVKRDIESNVQNTSEQVSPNQQKNESNETQLTQKKQLVKGNSSENEIQSNQGRSDEQFQSWNDTDQDEPVNTLDEIHTMCTTILEENEIILDVLDEMEKNPTVNLNNCSVNVKS